MAAPRYSSWLAGKFQQIVAVIVSAGAADGEKIVATDTNGRLHQSLMPSGIVPDQKTGIASGAISANDLCYIMSDGKIARASAAAGGNEAVGWATAAAVDGASVTIQMEGIMTTTGLTPGAAYFLSDATPGALLISPGPATSLANKLGQFIGTAISATELEFEPDRAVILQ